MISRLGVLLICAEVIMASPVEARVVRSLQEGRETGVILQHWDNSCGAAALATLLTYDQRYPISEEQVARGMLQRTDPLRVRHRGGFSLLDMKQFAGEIDFEATGWSALDLQTIQTHLPAIVPIHVRGYNHFVVVRKFAGDQVFIADPGWGNYQMATSRFQSVWPGIALTIQKR